VLLAQPLAGSHSAEAVIDKFLTKRIQTTNFFETGKKYDTEYVFGSFRSIGTCRDVAGSSHGFG
jgi:hypothetical protein